VCFPRCGGLSPKMKPWGNAAWTKHPADAGDDQVGALESSRCRFALTGAVLAAGRVAAAAGLLGWIVGVHGPRRARRRMAFNRLVTRDWNAANPRRRCGRCRRGS